MVRAPLRRPRSTTRRHRRRGRGRPRRARPDPAARRAVRRRVGRGDPVGRAHRRGHLPLRRAGRPAAASHPARGPPRPRARPWSLLYLLETVQETIEPGPPANAHAARARRLAGLLPALFLPTNYTRDVPSVSFKGLFDAARAADLATAPGGPRQAMTDPIWNLPNAELDAELDKLPSAVTWSRLEPLTLTPDLTPGLQTLLGDPLWMLGRQWQFGEFQGEDAGTPISAVVEMRTGAAVPAAAWRPSAGRPARRIHAARSQDRGRARGSPGRADPRRSRPAAAAPAAPPGSGRCGAKRSSTWGFRGGAAILAGRVPDADQRRRRSEPCPTRRRDARRVRTEHRGARGARQLAALVRRLLRAQRRRRLEPAPPGVPVRRAGRAAGRHRVVRRRRVHDWPTRLAGLQRHPRPARARPAKPIRNHIRAGPPAGAGNVPRAWPPTGCGSSRTPGCISVGIEAGPTDLARHGARGVLAGLWRRLVRAPRRRHRRLSTVGPSPCAA